MKRFGAVLLLSAGNDEQQREFALDEAGRMRVLASTYSQLGLRELARFLKKNADDAMKWAARNE